MLTKLSCLQRPAWLIVMGIGLVSAGCSDSATTADGPNARLDDTAPTCALTPTVFRLTAVDPSWHASAPLDLDDDGHPDDMLGSAADAITDLVPTFAIDPRFRARLATDVPWLLEIDRCAGASNDDEARVTLEQGVDAGSGGAPVVPHVAPRAVGWLRDGVLEADDGAARFPITALADATGSTADAGWLAGDGLRIHATLDATGTQLDGELGAALSTTASRTALAAPIAAVVTAQPPGDPMRIAADSNHDGVISGDEILASDTFQALTAADVVIRAPDGTPRTTDPTTSIAVHFTATKM